MIAYDLLSSDVRLIGICSGLSTKIVNLVSRKLILGPNPIGL